MKFRCFALCAVFLLPLAATSQTKNPGPPPPTRNPSIPSSPGSTYARPVRLEIQITNENSQPLNDVQAMVVLSSMGTPIDRTVTNMDGRANFSAKPGNYYQVTVSGAQIETATASFQLYPTEMNHNERIAVKLKKDAKAIAPGGAISANDLNAPPKARSEFSKGMEDMKAKKFESAKKHFEKAIQEYPKYGWAYNNLGVVEMELKNRAAARAAFEKAVELNDKNPDAAVNLAKLKLEENDFEGARILLNNSLIVLPNDPKALFMLAYCEFNTQHLDSALADAMKVHQGDVDRFPSAHLIAARVLEIKNDTAGAQRQYETYLKEAPDGPQAAIAKEGLVRLEAKK